MTLDVIDLFSSIPHCTGMSFLEEVLLAWDNMSSNDIQVLLDLIDFLLENNFLYIENRIYKQKLGVAMGAPCAPVFANIFMVSWETRYIFKSSFYNSIKQYYRYLDDLFILWGGTEAQLHEFYNYLNSVTGYLKFIINYSKQGMNFLDVELFKKDDGFGSKIYRKPTYCNALLHYNNCHPLWQKKTLVKGQMVHLFRLVSEDDILLDKLDTIVNMFFC